MSENSYVDIHRIMEMIPHRYPVLLIDRIIKSVPGDYAIGLKNVTINEPQFQGHFPENPVFPGVLLLEGMAQTAGVLCVNTRKESPPYVYFMTIDGAKFRKPVVPGDTLEYHMTLHKRRRNMWWYRGEAKVEGELVAEAMLSAMMGEG